VSVYLLRDIEFYFLLWREERSVAERAQRFMVVTNLIDRSLSNPGCSLPNQGREVTRYEEALCPGLGGLYPGLGGAKVNEICGGQESRSERSEAER